MHSNEAEIYILGCMLIDKECSERSIELKEDYFYTNNNRSLFTKIKALAEKNINVDIVELSKHYETLELDAIKQIAAATITTSAFEHYLKVLKDYDYRRNLLKASQNIQNFANDMDLDIDELIVNAEKQILECDNQTNTDVTDASTLVLSAINKVEERHKNGGKMPGLQSGFWDWDKLTLGLQKKKLIIIGGRPAMGKTSIAVKIIQSTSKKYKTLFFSMEMDKESIADRICSGMSRVQLYNIKTGQMNDEDWLKYSKASETLSESKLFIDDTPNLHYTDILTRARRVKKKYGLDVIVIDHLTEMKSKHKEKRIAVEENARGCKLIAKELDVPVILLAQLSRTNTTRSDYRPILSDLRETGAIEEVADIISFIHRKGYYNEDADQFDAELITRKNRDGATGTIKLTWYPQLACYGNKER